MLTLSLFSCNEAEEPRSNTTLVSQFNGVLPAIMRNDDSLFHGIALGMTQEEVKRTAQKPDSLSQEEKGYLFYEGRISSGKEYTWECTFDEKGLASVTVDIYLKDEETAGPQFDDFRNYFTKKYGTPEDTGESLIWTVSGKRPARIELYQEFEYAHGKLALYFYDSSFSPRFGSGSSDSLILP
ncbi:MAG: hypothetical protein Fur0041_13430 [Bacteroidia bacterium]